MSGELTLSNHQLKGTFLAVGLSIAASAVLALLLLHYLPLEAGFARGALSAFIAYVLFRLFYPICTQSVRTEPTRVVHWQLSDNTLRLDETTIPLSTIRQIHCWPNRDALGHPQPGWTINIETTGHNTLLRSLTKAPGVNDSVAQLHALVDILGYGTRWPDTE